MKSAYPRISVLMSVYNEERFVHQAVDSILNQTFSDFEFVIVDDGSSDGSQKILESYKDPRIVLIRNEQNIGLVRSLNRGLEMAHGKYLARMDADDISFPQRFEKQVAYLDAHPEAGVLGTQIEQVDENERPHPDLEFFTPLSHGMIAWKMFFDTAIIHPTVMMRRSMIVEHGGYDADYLHIEDTELWSRLIHVTRFANLPEKLYIRRWHSTSICNTHADLQRRVGVVICQRLMQARLGKRVPDNLVAYLTGARELSNANVDEVARLSNVVYQLYRASIVDSGISAAEKKHIRQDAAERLYILGRSRIRSLWGWKTLTLACWLRPGLLLRAVSTPLRRILRNSNRLHAISLELLT